MADVEGVTQEREPSESTSTFSVVALCFRLAGMIAVCLALVASPLGVSERIAVLTAIAIGVAVTAVAPAYEPVATRSTGLAILVVALVPPSGMLSIGALAGLVVLGAASCDHAGMARIVPAAGLPLATLTLRTGAALDPALVVAWLVAVAVTLALAAAGPAAGSRQPLGRSAGADPVRFGGRQLLTAAVVLAVVAPVSLRLADTVEALLPPVIVSARAGTADGPALTTHPGLSGGLDTGQPVELSDEVALRVRADRPRYWRGTTYDNWDGRRWTSDSATTPLTWSGAGVRLPRSSEPGAIDDFDLPEPVMITQQFTTERAGLDVLLGAWRIDSVHTAVDRAVVGSDGSVRLATPLGAGAAWTVTSEVVPATEADLRRADPLSISDGSIDLVRYASEADVSAATAELARHITAEAPTTYDKVRALETWMDQNLDYTRDIDTLPADDDAVDHLLFESRKGYCEQIGSALVVMLRSLGIPARLVVGYVPSDYDAASGAWLSKASDAHAWAEVYFPGIGWRGFDPTAGVPTAADEQPADALDRGLGTITPIAGIVLALTALSAFVVVLVRRRRRLGQPLMIRRRQRRSEPGEQLSADPLVQQHDRLDACGNRLGLEWPPTMTVRDRARSLVEHGIDRTAAEATVIALERATFGTELVEAPDAVLDVADGALTALEAEVDKALTRAAREARRSATATR